MAGQMRHSHAMVALLIALPLLCVVFIALLLIQQQEIGALQQEKSLLDERIVALAGTLGGWYYFGRD